MDEDWSYDNLSSHCKTFFDKCYQEDLDAGRNTSDFSRGCWKDWLEACGNEEPAAPPDSLLLALVVLVSVVAATSWGANMLVCAVFCVYRQLRLIKHYFVINLAAADMILAVVSVPLFVVSALTPSETAVYRAHIVLDVLCGTASMMTLAAISLERYWAVVYPLHYNSQVTHAKAMFGVLFTWLYALLVSGASLIPMGISGNDNREHGLFFGWEYVAFLTVSSFAFPLVVMFVAYFKIFRVARSHVRQIASFQPSLQQRDGEVDTRPGGPGGLVKLRFRRELKAAQTLMIIMGAHILCWAPLFVYLSLWTSSDEFRAKTASDYLNYVSVFLRYCNGLANPLIYCGINRQFRAAIARFVLRKQAAQGLDMTDATRTAAHRNSNRPHAVSVLP